MFFFVLSRAWDKEKILSPYEGSNLRPSDSALRCSTTRVLHTARIRNVDSVMFVDRNKRYGMYWARPSRPWDKEKIDALPQNNSTNEFSFKLFSIVLGYIYIYIICLNKKVVEHWSAESEGLRFDSSWGLKIFSLSHARDNTKKNKNTFLYFFTELKTFHLS